MSSKYWEVVLCTLYFVHPSTKESLSEPSLSSGNISIGKEKSKVTVINKDIEEEVSGAVNMEEKMEEERPDAEEEKKKEKEKEKETL